MVSYLIAALVFGVVGFAAVEFSGQTVGVITALTTSLAVDALIFALASVLLALVWRGPLRRGRGLRLLAPVLGFMLLFAPLAGLLGVLAGLTLEGSWGDSALVQSAFLLTPLNLMVALTVEVGMVALPLGFFSTMLLAWLARR